jgi:hypothetical protein
VTEQDELPAVYRSLSTAGLARLHETYTARLQHAQSPQLRSMLERRLRFLEAELAQRDE